MKDSSSSRREFLRGGLALGGLVAVSGLPAVADDPSVFPARGKFERLVLAYQHIDAGASKPFSILHISDTHLTEAYPDEGEMKLKLKTVRTQCFGGRQEEALRDSLDWAKKNVDYVLHTGDLIDWQSRANFDLVKKYYGPGMFGSLGNHEYSRNMWLEKSEITEAYKDGTRAAVAAAYPFDVKLSSNVVNGVNFVTLDDVYGYVTAEQVERFRAEVKKGLPIVLCMHVPFFTPMIWRAHYKFWRSSGRKFTSAAIPDARGDYQRQQTDPVTRDFISYLKGEPLLKGILAGHMHITVQDRFSPTAMQYVVGGNFMFHGQEVTFS
jgi:predicted MPP superfamily phosphohydrolase